MDDISDAMQITAAGIALLLAQGVIVSDPFYGRKEIEKYLKVRRRFHPMFAEAARTAADIMEEDPAMRQMATGLRMFANTPPTQFQKGLMAAERSLRSLRRVHFKDVNPSVRERLHRTFTHLRHVAALMGGEIEHWDKVSYWENLFDSLAKYKAIPAPLRTLFRKMSKMQPNYLPDSADPGAWFSMSPEQKVSLRKRVRDARQSQNDFMNIEDPDERRQAFQQAQQQLANLQGEAGVNLSVIDGEDDVPLDDLFKAERKLVKDGATEYVTERFSTRLRDYFQESVRNKRDTGRLTRRELGKLLTQLRKAKTFPTMLRVVQDATQRRVLSQVWVESVEALVSNARKNKVLANDAPLAPIPFEPKTVEQFVSDHDTGQVDFVGDWTDEQKDQVLGRVSAAISQLETLYGKGFCGKHAKKLDFRFYDGAGGTARASYFAWENRNRWQPRVSFGTDFDGVLAHELSHFLSDLLGYKAAKSQDLVPEYQYGHVGHGPGDVFGTTGTALTQWVKTSEKAGERETTSFNVAIKEIPEFLELMQLVISLPDYARWSDKIGNLDWYVENAVKNVYNKSVYDDDDLKHLRGENLAYKSEVPPEVLEEAIRLFTKDMDGDTRKLRYWNSSAEVWARLAEQYAYTKLAEQGITNPWLTRMTYDIDVEDMFVEEKTFDEKIVPIMDRIFAKLKERQLLASWLLNPPPWGWD